MIHRFSEITKNVSLTADVCVVGSGAGGAVVAKELAEAGLHVVMIEEGGHYDTKDFRVDDTVWSLTHLYRDGGATVIYGKPNILYVEGRCVGGSTTVNGATSWRTPEKIMRRWQLERELTDFTPLAMDRYFARVERHIHVKATIPEAYNRDSELLKLGAERLGYEVKENLRSQDRCVGTNLCIMGCPTGAKQSTALSYVPIFLEKGGEIYTSCRVHKVLTHGRRAVGVIGHFIDPEKKQKGHRLKVKAKVVVVCCGAVQTPALLKKSGIRDEAKLLGKNLIVHPNTKVVGIFDEPVNAWHGVNQRFQVTQYFDEGILMAVNFVPPGVAALAMPLEGTELLHVMKEEYHHMVMGGALIEDTGRGRVHVGPFDTIFPTYHLNAHDFRQSLRAVALLAEVFFAAGARKCYLPFIGLHEICSVDDIPKIYKFGFKPIDLELMTVHIMGTAQMGADPRNSVVGVFGEFHNIQGLYVADASVFPTSIGVNPQITIMALATRTAEFIAQEFRRYAGENA